MDDAQPAGIASTNSDGPRGDAVRGAVARYLKDLEGQPLAVRTREALIALARRRIDVLHAMLPNRLRYELRRANAA